jgi:hypothetical protein
MYIPERLPWACSARQALACERPQALARLTVTEQSERFDLDCRRELLHARTIAGAILPFHQTNEPCPRPGRTRWEGVCRRAAALIL